MHTVAVLALEDSIAFDLATPIEVFGRCRLPDGRPGYRVVVCGEAPVVQAGPLRLASDSGLTEALMADTIVVPGRNNIESPVSDAVIEVLRAGAAMGTRIVSICVGALVLAQAGLLDGQRATTHWRATEYLASHHPDVDVEQDALYVDNGLVATSAGAAAGLDLCLHLVRRDHGAAVASDTARLTVAPLHRSGGQAQFIVRNPAGHQTASLEDVLGWIEHHAHRRLSLRQLADAANLSVRTLSRRFHAETGQSPMEWVNGVRLRHAQELLETTDHGVERIARQVGFTTPSAFRSQFRAVVGVTPRAYRSAFRGGEPKQAEPTSR